MALPKSLKRNSLCPATAAWAAIILFIMLLSCGCGGKKSGEESADPFEKYRKSDTADPFEKYRNRGTAENAESGSPGVNVHPAAGNNNVAGDAFAAHGRTVRRPVAIPGGRTLTVRLLESISSRTASPGQRFEAELASPVVVNGKTVLPSRTPLRGRVVSARSSGRLHNPGYLRLTLDSLKTPSGRWVNIKTTSVWAQGQSHKKRDLTIIGAGTGLGAVIGAIAGGGKGAAIGAASGAGAGTVGAYATGKKDVTFPVERKLSFATVREIPISS